MLSVKDIRVAGTGNGPMRHLLPTQAGDDGVGCGPGAEAAAGAPALHFPLPTSGLRLPPAHKGMKLGLVVGNVWVPFAPPDRRQLFLPVCVNYSCRLSSC